MPTRPSIKKVVLAYTGGLDTSVAVPWLIEHYGCEVICFCANVGQGDLELEGLREKGLASGASKVIIKDVREEFATDFLFPMIQSGATYEKGYLLGTAVGRPSCPAAGAALERRGVGVVGGGGGVPRQDDQPSET